MTPLALVFGILGCAVVVAVAASAFTRRHGESTGPMTGWTPTDEVFQDPGTNRTMRVWIDDTGARHYVPAARRGPTS